MLAMDSDEEIGIDNMQIQQQEGLNHLKLNSHTDSTQLIPILSNQNQNEAPNSNNDSIAGGRHEDNIRIMSDMFRDLDNLTHCLADWNTYLVAHFKNKVNQLNDTQKQLFQENDQTKYLQQQLEKFIRYKVDQLAKQNIPST